MKTVYACFSTDIIHSGHLNIIKKASELGRLTVGVLTDEAVATYKRYPLISLEERMNLFSSLKGVSEVVVQETLDYHDILAQLKPNIVVHGDDWVVGYLAETRRKVIKQLKEWNGVLIEYPYALTPADNVLNDLERVLNMPESRRARLKKIMQHKSCLTVMEAHSGLTGLIVEKSKVETKDGIKQFDAMWVSSLCDSTSKGKPDIELVDMTSRINTVEEIMSVTTKPIILDGDTGGLTEHFVFNIQTLERIGVSAVIIEDKIGLKQNSLFGTEVDQCQDEIENFCHKIAAGKNALKTKDFMIIARCESLILKKGMEDALNRCFSYVKAGADGIMIHSKESTPDEVLEFCKRFRQKDAATPIVVVPSTFNNIPAEELEKHGINIVIYANHLIRSAFPAMKKTAEEILKNGRTMEIEEECLPIKDIIRLIPSH